MAHAAHRQRVVKATATASLMLATWGIEEGGSRLAGHPAAMDAPVTPLARVLFTAALPGVKPVISQQRQAQLEAAARRLDHYRGPGSWIRMATLILDRWREERDSKPGELAPRAAGWLSDPPRSLGALAIELRREANLWRYLALEGRTQRLRPLAEARQRARIKTWRAENRYATRRYGRWGITRPPHA